MFKFAAKKVWVNDADAVEELSLSDSDNEAEAEAERFDEADEADFDSLSGEVNAIPVSEMAELPTQLESIDARASMSEMAASPIPLSRAEAPKTSGFFSSLFSSFRASSPPSASPSPVAGAAASRPPPPPSTAPRRERISVLRKPKPRPPRREEYRQVDTNVFAVALGSLASDAHVLTGDPVLCSNCRAAFSNISRTTKPEGKDSSVWNCEFCGHAQEIDLEEEERPSEQTNDYLIEPPTNASSSDQLIVFVLDISGSMCVSSEVQGKIALRGGDRLEKLQRELLQDNGQQWLPGQNREVTFISRLQGAQAAISQQINSLKREHPGSRVALVTFSSDVTVIGDGSSDPVTITGDRLNDFDQLLAFGANVTVAHSIAESPESLDGIIWELQEGGATALGPAATVAVGIASKSPAAKIILCTDGLANVGVGALEDAASVEQKAVSRQWYGKLADIARGFGTSISVVSIAGSGCCMEYLGLLADQTNGGVDIVDPLKLTTNFASLLSAPTIASQVTATLLLHKALFIRSGTMETNLAIKEIGNVQANSEVTFEFGIRRDYLASLKQAATTAVSEAKKPAAAAGIPSASPVSDDVPTSIPVADDEVTISSSALSSSSSSSSSAAASSSSASSSSTQNDLPSEVPFQVQVHFRRLDGSKYLRVVTALQPISINREEVEEEIDMSVLGLNAIQQAAEFAHAGEYEKAKLHGVANRRFFQKKAKHPHQQQQAAEYISVQRELEGAVRSELRAEEQFHGFSYAPSEADKVARRDRRMHADHSSNVMYQMKSANPTWHS